MTDASPQESLIVQAVQISSLLLSQCNSMPAERVPTLKQITYSYALGCVKCKDYKYNWIAYLAVVYIPLTLFYIVVALFSAINFTSPTLHGVITFFQIAVSPGVIQLTFSNLMSSIHQL